MPAADTARQAPVQLSCCSYIGVKAAIPDQYPASSNSSTLGRVALAYEAPLRSIPLSDPRTLLLTCHPVSQAYFRFLQGNLMSRLAAQPAQKSSFLFICRPHHLTVAHTLL